jgi:hypothetical protein
VNNHFIRPFVPTQTQVIKEASEVNAMLLRKGIVTTILCDGQYDYSNGVGSVWNSKCRNLWIIEHDIIPPLSVIEELEKCPYFICAPLYFTSGAHSGLESPVIPHRIYSTEDQRKLTWISPAIEWADKVGLGCVKFRDLIRNAVDYELFSDCSWRMFDSKLSEAIIVTLGPKMFHIHNIWVEHKQK